MSAGDWRHAASELLPGGREFFAVSARYGRHCLIPMQNAHLRLGGARLYPGFRWSAKAYRAALRVWIGLGAPGLTRHVVQARGADWALGDLLRSDLPSLATAALLHVRDKYVVLLLMDAHGRALAYAKYAVAPRGRRRVANEARALALLPTGIAPRRVRFTPFQEGDLLVQTAVPGRPYTPRLQPHATQVRLLQALVRPGNAYPPDEHPFIQRLYAESDLPRATIDQTVEQLDGVAWPLAWMHGDFNFTNMHRWRTTCLAFDWANATEYGFPYLDAAFWMFSIAATFERNDPVTARSYMPSILERSLPDDLKAFSRGLVRLAALHRLVMLRVDQRGSAEERWLTAFVQP